MDPSAASTALSGLTEEVFSDVDKRNLLVFKAMEILASHNASIDVQSVADTLNNLKTYDDAGGSEYLMELIQSTISPDNIDHYVKIIKDQAVLRDYLLQIQAIQDAYAKGDVPDIGEFLAASTASLQEIASKRSVGEFKDAKTIATAVEMQIQKEANTDNRGLTGLDTGYKRLNKYTHGQKNVVAFDKDETKISSLKAAQFPFKEPLLNDVLKKEYKKILYTSDSKDIADADAYFLAVGTPSKEDGNADLSFLNDAVDIIEKVSKESKIIIRSTVPVGTAKKLKERLGAFRIISMPEFLAEGRSYEDESSPYRIVLGAEAPADFEFIRNLRKSDVNAGVPFYYMSMLPV